MGIVPPYSSGTVRYSSVSGWVAYQASLLNEGSKLRPGSNQREDEFSDEKQVHSVTDCLLKRINNV